MTKSIGYTNHERHQRTYLDGLKRYESKGVRIIIDGGEYPESDQERIFEMGEDGGFYMGNYVSAEQGCPGEVWSDKVYLYDPPEKKRKEQEKLAQ